MSADFVGMATSLLAAFVQEKLRQMHEETETLRAAEAEASEAAAGAADLAEKEEAEARAAEAARAVNAARRNAPCRTSTCE